MSTGLSRRQVSVHAHENWSVDSVYSLALTCELLSTCDADIQLVHQRAGEAVEADDRGDVQRRVLRGFRRLQGRRRRVVFLAKISGEVPGNVVVVD